MNKDLIKQYKILHEEGEYGISSSYMLEDIWNDIHKLNPKSILDYGCGQSILIDRIAYKLPNAETYRYDPAIEKYNKLPNKVMDLVICTDVLEHLPMEDIEELMNNLHNLSDRVIFSVSTVLAKTLLPNGQNCHITVKSEQEWVELIRNYYPIFNVTCSYEKFFIGKTW